MSQPNTYKLLRKAQSILDSDAFPMVEKYFNTRYPDESELAHCLSLARLATDSAMSATLALGGVSDGADFEGAFKSFWSLDKVMVSHRPELWSKIRVRCERIWDPELSVEVVGVERGTLEILIKACEVCSLVSLDSGLPDARPTCTESLVRLLKLVEPSPPDSSSQRGRWA